VHPLETVPFSSNPGAGDDHDPSGVRRQRRLRILVADDEPLVGAALKRALAAHEVVVVESGAAAVASINDDGPFDLVLCDVMMPDLSGPRVFEAVRVSHPEVRFIFITGGVTHEASRRALSCMQSPVLQKPFDLGTVRDLVRRCTEDDAETP
jgi:DNA-binding NtrC family response regulator